MSAGAARLVTDTPVHGRRRSALALHLALAYTVLVVYASLSPFAGWRDPGIEPFHFLTFSMPRYFTRFDILLNALAYLPLGFLATAGALVWVRPIPAAVAGILVATGVSLAMEALQTYLPGRISSNLDFLANAGGAIVGAVLAARAGSTPWIARVAIDLRDRLFLSGAQVDFGIALVALWFASQLDPSLPLMGIRFFADGIQAQLAGYGVGHTSKVYGSLSVMLAFTSVGLLLVATMRLVRDALPAVAVLIAMAMLIKFGAATLLLKRDAVFLWLSQEVFLALLAGIVIVGTGAFVRRRAALWMLAVSVCAQLLLDLHEPEGPSPRLALRFFDWNYGQLLNFTGLASAVGEAWPWAAAVFTWIALRRHDEP